MLPKILQVGKFYPPDVGGIERVMQDICEGMNKKGFICDVLCSNSKSHFGLDILESKARIYRTKSYGKLAKTSITPQMIYFLKTIGKSYDIIHLHLPDPMANLALLLANPKDKIIILHWHSDIIKQKYLLKLYKPLQTWLLKRADFIIGTTPKYIQESTFLQDFHNKCVAIPLGTTPVVPSVTKAKIPKNPKMLITMGRFVQYKGFEYAIRAMEFLPDDYHLCIGGSGELESSLKNLIAMLKLENKISFLGFIANEDLPRFYQESGIFILPSITKNEAFGLVQIEAMSYGVPVISCDIKGSGVPWVNENGYSGIIVPPKNPKALAQAVLKISSNYEFYSRNAFLRFQTHFTKDKMLDSIQELYIQAFNSQNYLKSSTKLLP